MLCAPAEGDTRMAGLWNLPAPHAPLFYTRLTEQQNLSVPHAPLAVGQSVSKCSPVLCPPHTLFLQIAFLLYRGYGGLPPCLPIALDLLPRESELLLPFWLLHPNGGAAEIAVAAHAFSANCIPIIIQGVWGLCPHVHLSPLTFPAYRSFKSSSTPPNSGPSSRRMAPLCRMAWSICSAGS